jgi:hypothetical protein
MAVNTRGDRHDGARQSFSVRVLTAAPPIAAGRR